jgi:hypothetical protein
VTYPLSPVATPDLAGAVKSAVPDSAGLRIGRVTSYNAGFITVAISDSDVLVDAAYLFGAYQPVLGDNVAVIKQGNQWLALGATSANPDDNPILNYSFEDGTLGVMPPGWTLYHDPISSDVASVETSSTTPALDGPKSLRLSLGLAVASVSSSLDYVSSAPFPVTPGELWAAHAWLVGSSASGPPWVRGDGTVFFSFYNNATNTYPTTAAPDSGFNTENLPLSAPWILVRSEVAGRGVEIPAGVSHARITLRTLLAHENTSSNYSVEAYWDRVIARKLP